MCFMEPSEGEPKVMKVSHVAYYTRKMVLGIIHTHKSHISNIYGVSVYLKTRLWSLFITKDSFLWMVVTVIYDFLKVL